MATQEKLLKSLETLRQLTSNQITDPLKKKEKIQHCNFVAEAILNPTIKIAKNFNTLLSFAIEVLLQLCDDEESDVRMTADECVNKIIRGMGNASMTKIQIELHKEIKANGSARSLRAALGRFALLAKHIRPHKGKPYVVNLLPCIVKILERNEESIHETLANSLSKIMTALGCFTMDNDIKTLLKACLNNIQSPSAVIRRTTSSCILTVCLNCRKPYIFLTYVLNILIDYLIPVQENLTSSLILGVMGSLRTLLPHIKSTEYNHRMQSSFGGRRDLIENDLPVERFLQIYELCLHYTSHEDHNIINASLETLNILLQNSSKDLKMALTNSEGITSTRITMDNGSKNRSPSQLSVATLISNDNMLLEVDLSDTIRPDIEKWIDESKLSVINVNYVKSSEDKEGCDSIDANISSIEKHKCCEYSNISIGTIQDQYAESLQSESIVEQIDKLVLSENSSEKSFSVKNEERSAIAAPSEIYSIEVDIGDYLDKNVPLIYFARYITKQFLLTGVPSQMTPDKKIRVSIKNLALSCLSSITQIYPQVLLMYLDRNYTKGNHEYSSQPLSDVLLFADHCDPQLRGAVRVLIASFVKAALLTSCGDYESWMRSLVPLNEFTAFGIKNLIGIILQGLQDESSTCRQTLVSLNTVLNYLLESEYSIDTAPILNCLPVLAKDPYWLVKVKLLEIITNINYVTVEHVFKSSDFQNKVIHNILFELLKDEDPRIRAAAANSIVKIIPKLYFEQNLPDETTVTYRAVQSRDEFVPNCQTKAETDGNINKKHFVTSMPFPFNASYVGYHKGVDFSLGKILVRLFQYLLTTTSKYYIFGCIETLTNLSYFYPTTIYKSAWGCFRNISVPKKRSFQERSNSLGGYTPALQDCFISNSADLLNISIHLLTNGVVGYDLNCHLNLMKLTGNVFSGKWLENFKSSTELNSETSQDIWDLSTDKTLSILSETFLIHVVRMLNVFAHIIEETVPTLPQVKLPNLPSTSNLSPIKRRKSDLGEKKILSPGKTPEKDDKGEKKIDLKINAMGYFANVPHYMKFYEILRIAYNNYKITLDSEASENFLGLLKTTLNTLSQILEIATLVETSRISEEILSYLKSTFALESAATVKCVRQLLKSLFGTNLSSDSDDIVKYLQKNIQTEREDQNSGFYYHVALVPYNEISTCINSLNEAAKVKCDGDSFVMGYLHRKENKKVVSKGSDKILANYIRIFEPMVIKSLKHYTITSDVSLQCQVLQLLSQLVQLRVNYCLLDSEQIFIGFVLKQFEFIEEGQISLPEELIPQIFQFLVHLSYGKQHSKSIIVIPKIIQLCDGLMASGQSPLTHCIPALKPIVEDVFLLRNKSNTSDFKELETTREVLVSMLLRLLCYGEVIELFVLILNESKYCDNAERWTRWSRQIFDVFLPMLKHNKIKLDEGMCMKSARSLIFALHPSVYKEVGDMLIILFGEPSQCENMNRYLAKVSLLLLMLSQIKEDKLLIKIMENQSEFSPQTIFEHVIVVPDPLNVTKTCDIFEGISPEVILIRFIFRVIHLAVEKCLNVGLNEEDGFIVRQFGFFLLYCLHIFQSGSHCKTSNVAISLISDEISLDKHEKIPINIINNYFLKLRKFYPLLTFQWCYLLTLLNYNDRKFWASIMRLTENYGINRQIHAEAVETKVQCINDELVRVGGSIIFSDYLCENILSDGEQMSWLLVNNIELLVYYHNEAPISELFSCIHRNSAASGLIIQAIATKCIENTDPTFRKKVLACIQEVHTSQTGNLLLLLIPKLINSKQLSISRNVAKLASRRIELLLTLPMEDVTCQLPKEELVRIMDLLLMLKLAKKHETLVGLLNKLATQFYDLSPLELDQRRSINPDYIKKLNIDKTWYLSQVKTRCHCTNKGSETADLLSKLNAEELIAIMTHKDFSKSLLGENIRFGINIEAVELLKACRNILLEEILKVKSIVPKPHQVFYPEGRESSVMETKYSLKMKEIYAEHSFLNYLQEIVPAIIQYIKSTSLHPDLKIPESHYEDFTKLGVICLETITYLYANKTSFNVDFVDTCLSCSDIIFKENYLCSLLGLDTHLTWLCSAINSLYKLVNNLLINSDPLPSIPLNNLQETLSNIDTRVAGQSVYQLTTLICWLEKVVLNYVEIPNCLLTNIKSIVISLARLPLVNSYVLTPPTAWKSGWVIPLSGPFLTQVPPLPIELLQEIEILEEFIFRIMLFGWSSRQQFEETWMCLLSVLSANPNEDSSSEEINALNHSTSLVVQAITSLLLQTLYYPQPGNTNVSKLIHVSRDGKLNESTTSMKKLKLLQQNFYNKVKHNFKSNPEFFTDVFHKRNLEKLSPKYSYGQLSTEYLQIATKMVEVLDEDNMAAKIYLQREKVLTDIGLDLNSCLQFLLDLYSQWISSTVLPLRLLQEVVKSILTISDIFTEKSQFSWMLEVCTELSKSHAIEDEVIHQYLVVGTCKAIAILSPDADVLEVAKKTITQSLKSVFISVRIAGIYSLLYILQGSVLGNLVIGGISEDMQLFLPIAVEYILCHINTANNILNQSQEHSLLVWTLAFYVIENIDIPNLDADFAEIVMNAVLCILNEPKINSSLYIPLLKGLERLLIKNKLSLRTNKRVMQLSLDKLKNTNPMIALPAAQLLFTSMYIEYADQLENTKISNGVVQSNPDHLVQIIEKISVIFDKIKKGHPFEVKILSSSLSTILIDFFSPSDILTKVISEFLSPQQRHAMLMSKVVFEIFEYTIQQSHLSLLQDWVVFSLTNFTQSFSIGMATWCLTCFFISASTNTWLRNMFPYVQKRIGRYEYEDRKIMCIAGTDFYNNLKTDVQKKMFVDTLMKVKNQADTPFNELLGCL